MVPPADVPEAGAVGLKPEEGFSSSPVTVQPDVSAAHAAVKAESSTVKTEPRTAADVHAPVKAEPDSEAAEPLLTTADASVDGDAKAEAPSSPSPLVYLAGLYDVTDAGVHSFVLLTTAASVTEWLHPRSPVVLSTAAEVDAWLDPSTPVAQAVALAARPAFDSLSWTPVTSALSKPTGWRLPSGRACPPWWRAAARYRPFSERRPRLPRPRPPPLVTSLHRPSGQRHGRWRHLWQQTRRRLRLPHRRSH